jgi:hypothetical protein
MLEDLGDNKGFSLNFIYAIMSAYRLRILTRRRFVNMKNIVFCLLVAFGLFSAIYANPSVKKEVLFLPNDIKVYLSPRGNVSSDSIVSLERVSDVAASGNLYAFSGEIKGMYFNSDIVTNDTRFDLSAIREKIEDEMCRIPAKEPEAPFFLVAGCRLSNIIIEMKREKDSENDEMAGTYFMKADFERVDFATVSVNFANVPEPGSFDFYSNHRNSGFSGEGADKYWYSSVKSNLKWWISTEIRGKNIIIDLRYETPVSKSSLDRPEIIPVSELRVACVDDNDYMRGEERNAFKNHWGLSHDLYLDGCLYGLLPLDAGGAEKTVKKERVAGRILSFGNSSTAGLFRWRKIAVQREKCTPDYNFAALLKGQMKSISKRLKDAIIELNSEYKPAEAAVYIGFDYNSLDFSYWGTEGPSIRSSFEGVVSNSLSGLKAEAGLSLPLSLSENAKDLFLQIAREENPWSDTKLISIFDRKPAFMITMEIFCPPSALSDSNKKPVENLWSRFLDWLSGLFSDSTAEDEMSLMAVRIDFLEPKIDDEGQIFFLPREGIVLK